MEKLQNGKRNVKYLLGELSSEEQQQLDEQLFVNDDYFERLMATEDELIEDYLRGQLSASDRQQFEKNLLNSSELRRKVSLTELLLTYMDDVANRTSQSSAISQYTHRGNYEGSIQSNQFLRQGLRTYQTYLWINAIFRLAVLGSLSLFAYSVSFTSGVGLTRIFALFVILIPLYALIEVINLSRAVNTAKLAVSETPSAKMTL